MTHYKYMITCHLTGASPAACLCLNWFRFVQFDTRHEVRGREGLRLLLSFYLTDLASQVEEAFFDVMVVLCAGFEEDHIVEISISLWWGKEGGRGHS